MPQGGLASSNKEARLASWKEIADYLGRSPRTVQRWLAGYNLPVHRMGGSSGPIFAYKDELDRWLRNRRHAIVPGAPASNTHASGPIAVPDASTEANPLDFAFAPGLRKTRSADLTLAAQAMWETASSTDFSTAVGVFREAIDLDPGNGHALAGLSFVLLAGGLLGSLNNPIYSTTAEDALRRAVELDPDAVPVLSARAWMKMATARHWKASRRYFADALACNPLFGPALVGRALLHIAEGSLAEASDLLLEAASQHPLSAPTTLFRCWNAYLTGHPSAARALIVQARLVGHTGPVLDALEALCLFNPQEPQGAIEQILPLAAHPAPHPLLLGVLGYGHAAAGQTREAHAILHGFMQARVEGRHDCSYGLALVFLGLHDYPNAMRWIKQSYADGSLWSLGFQSDPLLAPLRNDPVYQTQWHNLGYPASDNPASRLAPAS